MQPSWTKHGRMTRIWTIDGVGEALWLFGKEGGFRDLRDTAASRWLLDLDIVRQQAHQHGLELSDAAKQIVEDALTSLDANRQRALRQWLQVDLSGHGRDLGHRRDLAGQAMVTRAKPNGISGRTWERAYEQQAVHLLARSIDALARRKSQGALLAVCPFTFDEQDDPTRYMALGFVDELVSRLSGLRDLSVLSPASLSDISDEALTPAEIVQRASADLALTGHLGIDGTHQVLAVQVVGPDGKERWAKTFDLAVTPLVEARATIARAVSSLLGLTLSAGDTARLSQTHPSDPYAYELFLRSSALSATNDPNDNQIALGLVDQALARDPSFADAHALRGYLLWRGYFSGWGAVRATLDHALAQVEEAIALDPLCVNARYTRIRILWDLGLNEEALAEGHKAIKDAPHATESLVCLARALHNAGVSDLALGLVDRVLAREPGHIGARKLRIWCLLMIGEYEHAKTDGLAYHNLHPTDANTAWAVANTLLALERYDEAVAVSSTALRHDPTDATHWLLLGHSNRLGGDAKAAARAWQDGAMMVAARTIETPTNLRARAWLANIYAQLGEREQALSHIKFVRTAEPKNAYLAYRVVGAYAGIGEPARALEELRTAIDNGFCSVLLIKCEERLGLAPLIGGELYKSRINKLQTIVAGVRQANQRLVADLAAQREEETDAARAE